MPSDGALPTSFNTVDNSAKFAVEQPDLAFQCLEPLGGELKVARIGIQAHQQIRRPPAAAPISKACPASAQGAIHHRRPRPRRKQFQHLLQHHRFMARRGKSHGKPSRKFESRIFFFARVITVGCRPKPTCFLSPTFPDLAIHPASAGGADRHVLRCPPQRRRRRPASAPRPRLPSLRALLLGFAASIVYDLWLGGIVTPGPDASDVLLDRRT